MFKRFFFPLILSTVLLGCYDKSPISNSALCSRKEVGLVINQHLLNTEIACSNEDRANGLMNRSTLALDNGMIFLFADEKIHTFWMKNTLIPLSIAFVDSNWTIVDLKEMNANDETPVPSAQPALYAIEANQFWFSRNNIHIGDKITMLN